MGMNTIEVKPIEPVVEDIEPQIKEAKELVGQTLEAIVFLNNYTYPRSEAKSGEFAIVKMRVKEIISGEIPEELAGRYLEGTLIITVSGNMPKFEVGMEYRLTGKLVINKKYGPQYECQAVRHRREAHRSLPRGRLSFGASAPVYR